jgi:predicted metal-dependent hydrolase
MSDLPIDVIRSARRKRTLQAYVADGRIRVLVPAGLPAETEAALVADLVAKVQAKMTPPDIDLAQRAAMLAQRYELPTPISIDWSDRQSRRWGTCLPATRTILISRRLASMPQWVLDWVIVHELAHLAIPKHNAGFKALVGRYELGERAEGYLIAKSEG